MVLVVRASVGCLGVAAKQLVTHLGFMEHPGDTLWLFDGWPLVTATVVNRRISWF